MSDLLLLFGHILPKEQIAEKIKESATEYLLTKSEESEKTLSVYSALWVSKEITDKKGLESVMKDSKQLERIKERMDSEAQ